MIKVIILTVIANLWFEFKCDIDIFMKYFKDWLSVVFGHIIIVLGKARLWNRQNSILRDICYKSWIHDLEKLSILFQEKINQNRSISGSLTECTHLLIVDEMKQIVQSRANSVYTNQNTKNLRVHHIGRYSQEQQTITEYDMDFPRDFQMV